MPFCGVVWPVAYDTFPLKTSKICLWKRRDDHHKISFSNNRKTKLNFQSSPAAISCNKHDRTQQVSINLEYKHADKACSYTQSKPERMLVYDKIKVDKLFRKAFYIKSTSKITPTMQCKATNPHKIDVSQDTENSLKITKI